VFDLLDEEIALDAHAAEVCPVAIEGYGHPQRFERFVEMPIVLQVEARQFDVALHPAKSSQPSVPVLIVELLEEVFQQRPLVGQEKV
jgi:hypothetical protein